ncbi:MAG: hypothetical protein J2P54_12935, partial [Bradyrhizobiaceae bacterium]|nr:hypothetical protein [Bradyrhizobiaceae bacterium]
DSPGFNQDYTDFPAAVVTQVVPKRHARYGYGDFDSWSPTAQRNSTATAGDNQSVVEEAKR